MMTTTNAHRKIMALLTAACTVAGVLASARVHAAWTDSPVPGVQTMPVGESPRGVAAHSPSRLTVVVNKDAKTVSIVNLDTGTVNATVSVASSPMKVVTDSSGAKAYVLHEKDRVSVINIVTGVRTAEWSISGEHISLAINPAGTELAVATKDPKRLRRINTSNGSVTQTINLGYKPKALSYNADGTLLLLATENDGVRRYNTSTGVDTGSIPVNDGLDLAYWTAGDRAILIDRRKLHILNLSNSSVEASISAGSRLFELTIDSARGMAYAADRDTNAISAVDLSAKIYRGRYPISEEPSGISLDTAGPAVLTTFKKKDQLTRVDPSQAPLTQSVFLGEKLSRVGVAVDDAGDRAIALADSGKAFVIKLSDKTFTTVPFSGRPTALGIDDRAKVALIGLNKRLGLVFVDLNTNALYPETIPLEHDPVAIAVDPTRGLALVAIDKSDQLVLVDTRTRSLISTLNVPGKFKDAAIHRGQGKAYVVNQAKDNGEVLVYDLASRAVTGTITVSKHAESIVIDEELNQAFVAIEKRDTIEVIDLNLGQVNYSQPLSRHPLGLAINPETHTVVVVAKDSDQIALLDLVTRTLTPYFVHMDKPLWVAVTVRYNQALITAAEKDEIQFLPLPNPVPVLTEIVPPDLTLPTPSFAMMAVGKLFIDGAKVYLDDRALVTRWIDSQHLEAEVPAELLGTAGIFQVKVINPTPKGGASNTLPFTMKNPVPVLAAISPHEALAGSATLNLNVTGEKFVSGSIVRFGTQDLSTTFVNAGHLMAVIPAALLANSASVPVTVVNPTPGGGASNIVYFAVTAQAGPRITAISPIEGEPGTNVTITGSGFEPVLTANQVRFAGNVPATVLTGSTTQLVVPVPPGALTGPISVTTPTGSAMSETFTVKLEQNMSLLASPANLTLVQGAANSFSVQLASTGTKPFTSLVTLSTQGVPGSVTAEFSPPAMTAGGTVKLTLKATNAAAPQSFTFNVVGTFNYNGQTLTRTVPATVNLIEGGQTGVKGRIISPEGVGVAGVHVRHETIETTTDAAGNFQLLGVPAGQVTLRFDATPANPLYPIWPYMADTVEGKITVLADWTLNPPPPAENFKPLLQNASIDQNITDERYPGLKFKIPAGVSIIGWDGVPKDKIAVERIEVNKLPVTPPPVPIKESYQLYFGTPMGGVPSAPIPVTLPNVAELEPGDKTEIWYYDGSPMGGSGEWKLAGPATIDPDGKTATTDPGYGIPRFCGVCGLVSLSCPPPPPGPPCGGSSGGNPVDLYSGQEFPRVGEMSCNGAVSFEVARSYGPVDAFGDRAGTTGSIGYGWALNYDIMLLPFSGPQKRLVIPPNQRVNFTLQPDGTYRNTDRSSFSGAELVATNASAHEWEVRFKDGRVWKFRPFPGIPGIIRGGPPTFLTEQVDPKGTSLQIARASNGHILAVGVPGRTINMTYGSNNFISEMRDSIGRTVNFTYNSDNRLQTVTDSSLGVTSYTYVGDNEFPAEALCPQPTMEKRIKTITYPGINTVTENHYGPSRRILRQTSALGEHRFSYKLTGACVVNVSNPGVRCAGSQCPDTDSWENYQAGWRIYGGQPVATTVIDPAGRSSTQSFESTGQTIQSEDEFGNKITRKFDAKKRLVQETDVLGRTVRFGYDENGNQIYDIDAEGRLSEYDFHPIWNKVTEVRRSLDGVNKVTLQQYTYDSLTGNVTSRTDANGRKTTYQYNNRGQILKVIDPQSKITTFEYNSLGDLIGITDPLGRKRRMISDAIGRTVEISNALGETARFTLNARGQKELVTDPVNTSIKLEYDVRGNLIKVTNQNGIVIETNTYDDRGRVLTSMNGAGKVERYSYEVNGNLKTYTDRKNQTTTYSYDLANRVIQIDYADGTKDSRTYDAVGRLTSASNANGTVGFQYDNLDRMAQVTTPQGTIKYGYDALDRRNRIETPQQVTTYAFDNAGQLTSIIQGQDTTSIDYDEKGQRKTITYPNGIVGSYSYDDAGQLTGLSYAKGATVIEALSYVYDLDGNVVQRVRTGVSSKQESPKNAEYDPLTNRLVKNNGETFQYDDQGNMISRTNSCGTATYTWNAKNQLTNIQSFRSDCSALSASFAYDALGRRVQKTIDGHTTAYLYDGMNLIAEVGAANANYLRTDNMDEAIARYSAQSDRYFLSDLLGSTQILTDRQGNPITSYSYSPFGETAQSGQSSDNPVQYTGRENDGTDLYYYRARYYAPDLGRFLSNDPLGIAGGINGYNYASNSPLRFVDPLGLSSVYRWPGNNYGDIPPPGAPCEKAIWRGGYIVGWAPCDPGPDPCSDSGGPGSGGPGSGGPGSGGPGSGGPGSGGPGSGGPDGPTTDWSRLFGPSGDRERDLASAQCSLKALLGAGAEHGALGIAEEKEWISHGVGKWVGRGLIGKALYDQYQCALIKVRQ